MKFEAQGNHQPYSSGSTFCGYSYYTGGVLGDSIGIYCNKNHFSLANPQQLLPPLCH